MNDVDNHIAEITDESSLNIWKSVGEALEYRLKKLHEAGIEPMETVYAD